MYNVAVVNVDSTMGCFSKAWLTC